MISLVPPTGPIQGDKLGGGHGSDLPSLHVIVTPRNQYSHPSVLLACLSRIVLTGLPWLRGAPQYLPHFQFTTLPVGSQFGGCHHSINGIKSMALCSGESVPTN